MDLKNEKEVNEKLRTLTAQIPIDLRNIISKYVAKKLVIMRRDFISGLTIEDIKFWCKS